MRIAFVITDGLKQGIPWQDTPLNITARLPILWTVRALPVESMTEVGKETRALYEFRPDVVVCDPMINPGVLEDLHRSGTKIIYMAYDTEMTREKEIIERLDLVDYYVMGDSLENFRHFRPRVKSEGLFFAGNLVFSVVFRHLDLEKKYDIGMLGSLVPELKSTRRTMLLDYLVGKFASVERHGGVGRWLPLHQYVEEINRTRICINRDKAGHNDYSNLHIKQHVFEALSCGAFLMTDSLPQTMEIVPTTAVVYYKDEADCAEKAHYYLEHEAERLAIARKGYQWFHQTYNFEVFWSRLLARLEVG